jgi:mannose-6-phosphate isomerase-like protein (cupin superfamily)
MTEKEWIAALEQEGFTDVRVCPIPPRSGASMHTHDQHTVHVILKGDLTITDDTGTKTFSPGSRVDFPAGTKH